MSEPLTLTVTLDPEVSAIVRSAEALGRDPAEWTARLARLACVLTGSIQHGGDAIVLHPVATTRMALALLSERAALLGLDREDVATAAFLAGIGLVVDAKSVGELGLAMTPAPDAS